MSSLFLPAHTKLASYLAYSVIKKCISASTEVKKAEFHNLIHAYVLPESFSGFEEIRTNPHRPMQNSLSTEHSLRGVAMGTRRARCANGNENKLQYQGHTASERD